MGITAFSSDDTMQKGKMTMVIYEVNASMPNALLNDYIIWLKPHIQKMLTFDGFESAQYFIEENNSEKWTTHVCVQYQLTSKQALDHYFKHHVVEMRQDKGIEKFEGQLKRNWRILRFVEKFEPDPEH